MITIDLSGKSILITGALGAIAEPMIRKLAAAGATLVLLDIKSEDSAKQTLRDWKIPTASYVYFETDITDSAALNRTVNECFCRFPALDTVLGHAGGCGLHPFAATSEADYERIFRFNYFAQVNLARAVFAQWIERKIPGHLIFTSSYVARTPHTQIPSYASAKAALENFARCMALEYADTGIRVNVVSRRNNVDANSGVRILQSHAAGKVFQRRFGGSIRRNLGVRRAGNVRRREDEVAGNLAFDPLREDGPRQINLGEIVKAKDAFVIGFGCGREGMQPAASGVAENGIEGREAAETFVHCPVQRSGVGNIGFEVNIRCCRNFPVTERLLGRIFGFDVEQNQSRAR